MLWLRALLFIIAVQITAVVILPLILANGGAHLPEGPWRALGIVPLVAGALAILWSNWAFVTYGRGTAAPYNPPRSLVATGLYRFVRNPMYVGATLVIVGLALWTGALILFAYAIVITVAYNAFVRWYEEPRLSQRFGASYDEYTRAVPRFIPRLRPWSSSETARR
jgi:protein-S-isoprenylcysteine O-methyltransferase Ste14